MASERDRAILTKIKNAITKEELLKKERSGLYGLDRARLDAWTEQKEQERKLQDEEELTDEEYDIIYDDQQDDTVDETCDETYNAYYQASEKNKKYDAPFPDGFENWSNYAKNAWKHRHIIKE